MADDAEFGRSVFYRRAVFRDSTFAERVGFSRALFFGDVLFRGAEPAATDFDGCRFLGRADFSQVVFHAGIRMRDLEFGEPIALTGSITGSTTDRLWVPGGWEIGAELDGVPAYFSVAEASRTPLEPDGPAADPGSAGHAAADLTEVHPGVIAARSTRPTQFARALGTNEPPTRR
ncbi:MULTISPECIES: pentapeptide repeat-containing protein [Catenuloplanes]|uniref:Pentapeptide repeat-containing protein n=1 Tax=Catenuloplanes niger TaxID=587534 RepID=A0AAE4CWJ8_9ACTN|nr:pentapeptide repeat-containing protein [Catenuloplanes niger]MDR7326547.1 hypothetical protein [Catenuloplanes niger]